MRTLITLCIVGGAAFSSLRAQPDTLPLHRGPGHLRTMTVRVAGRDVEYLFDTGGGVTVISPEDSATLGCVLGGKGFGVRLTGEPLRGRNCANVNLAIGRLASRTDAGVMDLAKLLGPGAPAVHGMISLMSFRDRLITLDLAANRLIVETPKTLAERTRRMTPIDVRLATGPNGGELEAFIGLTARNGAKLWFEWDSENNASTLIAPSAAALLGADTTNAAFDMPVQFAPGVSTTIPVRLKGDMIHDGVLSAGFLERATWSVDLEHGRMWVGPIAPLPTLAADSPDAAPPAADPTGIYETTVTIGDRRQRGILTIVRRNGELTGTTRAIGDDQVVPLRNVTMTGRELSYEPAVPNSFQVHLTFDGIRGEGTWGDGGVKRGGAITAIKRARAE